MRGWLYQVTFKLGLYSCCYFTLVVTSFALLDYLDTDTFSFIFFFFVFSFRMACVIVFTLYMLRIRDAVASFILLYILA